MPTPRNIVPIVGPAEPETALAAPPPHLTYHGGHLLANVEVTTIFWGAAWTRSPDNALVTSVNQFFDDILGSSLIDLLAEYGAADQSIGHGSRTATVTISRPEPGRALPGGGREINDGEIQTALQGWIAGGDVDGPNGNTLYFVYLPRNVTAVLDDARSCQLFCGYHNHIGDTVFYAVEPFLTCDGCKFGEVIDSLTKVSSHELCEAITDPTLDAWFDDTPPRNEIGDICNTDTQRLGRWTVQSEWSNEGNACLIRPFRHLFTGSPAAVSWGPDRLDFFGIGRSGDTFGRWVDLGRRFVGSPAAVSWGPDRLDFFGIGTDGAMYQRAWTGDTFGDWVNLGGHFTGSPAAVSWGPDRLDFFGIGTDGAMYQRAWTGDTFGDWVNLGGHFTGSPAAVSPGPATPSATGSTWPDRSDTPADQGSRIDAPSRRVSSTSRSWRM